MNKKEKFLIEGGTPLRGQISISGAKNAALPVMAASLLIRGECCLENVPSIIDIKLMAIILRELGIEVTEKDGKLKLNTSCLGHSKVRKELAGMLRASILLLGPLLTRVGKAKIALPGGCCIGSRPIDLHLKGLLSMGAGIKINNGYIEAQANSGLKGAHIYLDFPSVGATENIMLAASLARGTTVIENASTGPEIVDLSNFLQCAGVRIKGVGTRKLSITGTNELSPLNYSIIPDRIEAGTFMIAAGITGGDILLKGVYPEHLKTPIDTLKKTGVQISMEGDKKIRIKGFLPPEAIHVETLPYPGFPTDLQPQLTSFLCLAKGKSVIVENVFENRFAHIVQLQKMGAQIAIKGRNIIIKGTSFLKGAVVKAPDIRGGAALILAGLAARGQTEIFNVQQIDRGYQELEKKLAHLGAKIERMKN